jgi:hypothetical protein
MRSENFENALRSASSASYGERLKTHSIPFHAPKRCMTRTACTPIWRISSIQGDYFQEAIDFK